MTMFIDELPYDSRHRLCNILDVDLGWEKIEKSRLNDSDKFSTVLLTNGYSGDKSHILIGLSYHNLLCLVHCDNHTKSKNISVLVKKENNNNFYRFHRGTLPGGMMGYDVTTLSVIGLEIYRGGSPTREILKKLTERNITIQQLYNILAQLDHQRAMAVLEPYI